MFERMQQGPYIQYVDWLELLMVVFSSSHVSLVAVEVSESSHTSKSDVPIRVCCHSYQEMSYYSYKKGVQ